MIHGWARTIAAAATMSSLWLPTVMACEDGHWIDQVLADGKILRLEDGSIWRVDPIDTITSSIWLPISNVIVCDDKIVNVDDGESVHARRLR